MTNAVVHLSLDVKGAIQWPKRLRTGLLLHPDGRTMSADEARAALLDTLAEGVLYVPIEECSNFDPKQGCLGHAREGPTDAP